MANVVEVVNKKLLTLPRVPGCNDCRRLLGSCFDATVLSSIRSDSSTSNGHGEQHEEPKETDAPPPPPPAMLFSESGVVRELDVAVKENFVDRRGATQWYSFAQDRIREGAYALTPDRKKGTLALSCWDAFEEKVGSERYPANHQGRSMQR